MRRAEAIRRARAGLRALLLAAASAAAVAAPPCDKPVYLTFDTGHMGVAPLVADVLKRHDVKVTFFLANERTKSGGGSLDDDWAPWWRERAAEGHAFGSHTWDHDVWRPTRRRACAWCPRRARRRARRACSTPRPTAPNSNGRPGGSAR